MDSSDRIQNLERELTDLRVSEARLSGSVDHLSRSVGELTTTVGELRDAMNRGKGALWTVTSGAALVGGIASYAAGRLFGG